MLEKTNPERRNFAPGIEVKSDPTMVEGSMSLTTGPGVRITIENLKTTNAGFDEGFAVEHLPPFLYQSSEKDKDKVVNLIAKMKDVLTSEGLWVEEFDLLYREVQEVISNAG